jgi:hypothetical protein
MQSLKTKSVKLNSQHYSMQAYQHQNKWTKGKGIKKLQQSVLLWWPSIISLHFKTGTFSKTLKQQTSTTFTVTFLPAAVDGTSVTLLQYTRPSYNTSSCNMTETTISLQFYSLLLIFKIFTLRSPVFCVIWRSNLQATVKIQSTVIFLFQHKYQL